MLESSLIKLQALRTATLLERDSNTGFLPWNLRNFYEHFCFTKHLQWLLLTVSGFQLATLLKLTHQQRCFSVNFAKLLRTSFDRRPSDNCFLSLSVNLETFFRTSLLKNTSEKLLISCTRCRISTTRYSINYFTGAFQ